MYIHPDLPEYLLQPRFAFCKFQTFTKSYFCVSSITSLGKRGNLHQMLYLFMLFPNTLYFYHCIFYHKSLKWYLVQYFSKLTDAVEKILTKEQHSFWKRRGCFDKIFTIRLNIEKYQSHQTLLVLSFIEQKQIIYSTNRRAISYHCIFYLDSLNSNLYQVTEL